MTLIVDNDRYSIDSLELGPMENFIYLFSDKKTKQAAIVDPAWDVPEILKLAKNKGVTITDVLLTHSHPDHINGIDGILEQHDAQLHLLNEEAKFWGEPLVQPSLHHGEDVIKIGKSEIKILYTPGHTPGSACYQIDNNLLTGDTMFVFGCGHCRLGGDPNVLYDTLSKLGKMPGDTLILPGHNYAEKATSTMHEQCEGNPFLQFDTTEDFVEYREHTHDATRVQPYHAELKPEK